MANILQAAKWMQEGKRVRRPQWIPDGVRSEEPVTNQFSAIVWADDGRLADIGCVDLLADDWEIAPQS